MTIPVTKTSQVLNRIFKGRPARKGRKLARLASEAGRPFGRRSWRKLDTEDKIWTVMEGYLKQGALLTYTFDGSTPLDNAAYRGQCKIAEKLIENGADVNTPGSYRRDITALMRACQNADPKMTRLLLQHGAMPGLLNDYGYGPVDSLVDAIKPNTHASQQGLQPSLAAAQECLQAMLEYGLTLTPEQNKHVFEEGQALAPLLPAVQAALEMKAAMENNDLAALRDLLVAGFSPDLLKEYHAETPLCHAAATGNLPMIELMLSAGAQLESPSAVTKYTPLQAATFNGQKEAFVLLLQKGADPKAPCDVKYDDPTTLDDVAKHSINPRMTEFVQNVLDTIASAPPPVDTTASIKINKPLRIRQTCP